MVEKLLIATYHKFGLGGKFGHLFFECGFSSCRCEITCNCWLATEQLLDRKLNWDLGELRNYKHKGWILENLWIQALRLSIYASHIVQKECYNHSKRNHLMVGSTGKYIEFMVYAECLGSSLNARLVGLNMLFSTHITPWTCIRVPCRWLCEVEGDTPLRICENSPSA